MDWREALNMILGAYNLTTIERENYIVITTLERRRLAEESGDLHTSVVGFNFIDVSGIQKTLSSMLSARGKIETDVRTNSLIITDIPDRIDKIREVALQLDTKTPQVMIEAMLLTVKLNEDEQLGIDWTVTHKDRPERSVALKESLGKTEGLDIRYGKTLLSWANLTTLIEYWRQNKKVDILANPRILTLDNLTAVIDLTEQVPYTEQVTSTQSASSVTSTQFKDVSINLQVKPHITKDNYIFMTIKTEQSYLAGYTSDTQPIIDSRKAETNVMVREGETIVIGGLRKKEDNTTVDKVPILGDIPFLGSVFKKTIKAKVDTELLIFVTPRLATETILTENEIKQLEKTEEMKAGKKTSFKQAIPFSLRAPSGN